jgi:hypothetical protein
MKKPPKQGAAGRGLELVGLIRGVPTQEEIAALAAALKAAAENGPSQRAIAKNAARGRPAKEAN